MYSYTLHHDRPITEYACAQELKFVFGKDRQVGRPAVRWLDSIEGALKTTLEIED
jgi:hypothetical protein